MPSSTSLPLYGVVKNRNKQSQRRFLHFREIMPLGSVNNTGDCAGRKCKHIFNHQDWILNLLIIKEICRNRYLSLKTNITCTTLTLIYFLMFLICLCWVNHMSEKTLCRFFLSSSINFRLLQMWFCCSPHIHQLISSALVFSYVFLTIEWTFVELCPCIFSD